MTYTIQVINTMTQAEFTAALGFVFEKTPAIAAQAWDSRPFSHLDHLHQTMADIVRGWPAEQQVALICAHPDLGSRLQMADASVKEQSSVGLDQLNASEYEQFSTLNQAYKVQFGFPFIIAVRNHTKASILAAFQQRLHHRPDQEQAQAIAEILEIARLRLQDIISGD